MSRYGLNLTIEEKKKKTFSNAYSQKICWKLIFRPLYSMFSSGYTNRLGVWGVALHNVVKPSMKSKLNLNHTRNFLKIFQTDLSRINQIFTISAIGTLKTFYFKKNRHRYIFLQVWKSWVGGEYMICKNLSWAITPVPLVPTSIICNSGLGNLKVEKLYRKDTTTLRKFMIKFKFRLDFIIKLTPFCISGGAVGDIQGPNHM